MMMYIQSKICFSTNIVAGVRAIIKIQDELSSVIHHYCVSSRERESRQSEPLTHRRTSLRFADTSRATLFFAGNYPLSSPDSPPSFHETHAPCVVVVEINQLMTIISQRESRFRRAWMDT